MTHPLYPKSTERTAAMQVGDYDENKYHQSLRRGHDSRERKRTTHSCVSLSQIQVSRGNGEGLGTLGNQSSNSQRVGKTDRLRARVLVVRGIRRVRLKVGHRGEVRFCDRRRCENDGGTCQQYAMSAMI